MEYHSVIEIIWNFTSLIKKIRLRRFTRSANVIVLENPFQLFMEDLEQFMVELVHCFT
jgi:hypothetical protein